MLSLLMHIRNSNYQTKLIIACIVSLHGISVYAVTLEGAIQSALNTSSTLRASKFNELATAENISIARSRLLPQISVQGSSSQLTQTTTQDFAIGGSTSRSFSGPSVNHQIVIRQALLRPRELSSLRYAELQTQYMALKYKSEENELKYRVILAWIDLLLAQQTEHAYERLIHLMMTAAMQERSRFELGDSTKDSVMEFDAQYQNARATYFQAIETLKAKQNAFENLTKIPVVDLVGKKLAIDLLPVFSDADKIPLWDNFQIASVELQMAKLQEKMQLERVKMAEADHKPTLDILAAVNLAQNDATSTQGYRYKNKQFGLQYTLPLFSGGAVTSSISQAVLGYEVSLAESTSLLDKLKNEYEVIWSELKIANLRKNSQIVYFHASEEQVISIRRNLELGVKSIADLANAELVKSKRLVDLINYQGDYIKGILKMTKFKYISNLQGY
jgi:protease secretion system outer membrane protein